ncbi:MAG: hypothetical protein ACPGDD_04035, partial [Poseidonia sp.]
MAASDETEVFVSLEDDSPVEQPKKVGSPPAPIAIQTQQSEASSEQTDEETSALEADLVDTTVLTDATGSYTVSWPILGMDCPDCASKATRAMNQMKQVSNPNVSVTSGEVKFDVDLELGPVFEISSVL